MENEPPTSAATTGATEPEVMAGIASGKGQPAGYSFEAGSGIRVSRGWMLAGTSMLLGLACGLAKRPGRHG